MSEENSKENQKQKELGKEEPIPLITIEQQYDTDEFGSLEITTEGMEFLMSIKNVNISILSIVGPSKTGKSLLSDFIIGEQDAFPSSKETKGICIWGKPITLENGSTITMAENSKFEVDNLNIYDGSLLDLRGVVGSVNVKGTFRGEVDDSSAGSIFLDDDTSLQIGGDVEGTTILNTFRFNIIPLKEN